MRYLLTLPGTERVARFRLPTSPKALTSYDTQFCARVIDFSLVELACHTRTSRTQKLLRIETHAVLFCPRLRRAHARIIVLKERSRDYPFIVY